MNKIKKLSTNQSGFASMVIALILVLVLALMTIGFAQLARREQQKALDKQLAAQANYAAESAINDAINDIKKNNGAIPPGSNSPNCIHPATGATSDPTIDTTSGATYSCLLVNLKPTNLIKNPLGRDTSWNVAFSTSANIGKMTVTWSSFDGHNTRRPALSSPLLPISGWGTAPPLLQFSITPLTAVDRVSLINNMYTAYLYPSLPSVASNTVTYAPRPSNVSIVTGRCAAATATLPAICKSVIDIGASLNTTGPFLVHVYGYYDAASVTITATPKVGATPIQFVDGQAQIDATGKAQNVLKRLQARVPLNGLLDLPNYAIEAQDICKRFTTGPPPLTSAPDPDLACVISP